MTTKKNKLMALSLVAALGFMTSCGDFGSENVNPNAANTPVTSAILTEAITGIPSTSSTGALTGGIAGRLTVGATEPRLFAQYWSQTQYPEASLYSTTYASWTDYYATTLQDFQTIIDYNTNESTKAYVAQFGSNNNQIAVSRILKAYMFWVVTDRWGDVPYFGALKGSTQITYDPQQAIYADLFKELKEANAQFDNGAMAQGDILYNRDAGKWKKFANSLRMLMALRLTKVDPATAKTEFTAAYTDPAGYISTNADNAALPFTDATQFRNTDNVLFDGRNDYAVSDVLVNKLKALSDPRLGIYADKTQSGDYIGIPYGLRRDTLTSFTNVSQYSRPGAKILARTAPGYIVTAAEMLLAKSEAAARGWITDDAIQAYNDAIKASFGQWGLSDAAYTTYATSAAVAATTADILTKIGDQRWIALYPNGTEAWIEWRRTGYPALKPTPFAVNPSREIPRRYGYPNTEPTLNTAAYNAAIGNLSDGDQTSSRVWWDK